MQSANKIWPVQHFLMFEIIYLAILIIFNIFCGNRINSNRQTSNFRRFSPYSITVTSLKINVKSLACYGTQKQSSENMCGICYHDYANLPTWLKTPRELYYVKCYGLQGKLAYIVSQ